MLTLVADYRLYPEVRYPDFLSDSALALRHGLEHAAELGGNPKRVFVMGHSAGGYNAAMLALDARWLRAVGHAPGELAGFIGLAGAYDFLPMTNLAAQPAFFHPNYPAGTQPLDHVGPTSPRSFLGAAKTDTPDRPAAQQRGPGHANAGGRRVGDAEALRTRQPPDPGGCPGGAASLAGTRAGRRGGVH